MPVWATGQTKREISAKRNIAWGWGQSLMAPNQPAFDAVIPASVRYDPELRPNAKILYGEIRALATKDGFCGASNAYFAELYGISQKTASMLISTLARRGHVWVELERDERTNEVVGRKIWVSEALRDANRACPPPPQKKGRYPSKKGDPPPQTAETYIMNSNIRDNIPPLPPNWAQEAIMAWGLPEPVKQALGDWVAYKREDKHDSYKPRGLQALLKKAEQYTGQYGAGPVVSVIEESMASGYKGITWDRLRFQAPVERKARVEERGQVNDW